MLSILVAAYLLGFKLMAYFVASRTTKDKDSDAITVGDFILPPTTTSSSYESPLLIFTCQRANYLSDTLTDILHYIPQPCTFGCPIIVSQDGDNFDVDMVIRDFKRQFANVGIPLIHIRHQHHHHHQPPPSEKLKETKPYEALAKHYGWALSQVFHGKIHSQLPMAQRVVILEEDIHIAPDFFEYMAATSKILDHDPSLLAVSAFNDNGHLVNDPTRILRSDFFPDLAG